MIGLGTLIAIMIAGNCALPSSTLSRYKIRQLWTTEAIMSNQQSIWVTELIERRKGASI